jgi:tryptophan-rich sensory protein
VSNRIALLAFILLTVGGGLLIGVATAPGDWYAGLQKPPFNPPNWVFGPVWTVLYILIAIAGWRIWRRDPHGAAMKFWIAQLALNFIWSPLFFSAHLPGAAFVVIIALLVVILALIMLTLDRERVSAWLLVPYALWVAFAALLNASIWWLN